MRIIQPEKQYLIHLLASVIKDMQPSNPPGEMDWEKLYRFAVRHGVANMAWYGLNRLKGDSKPTQEVRTKFRSDCAKAIAKEATQHITVEQILKTFEENGIACMPLKGYLVKYLYPRPDMRLMADVDILIKGEQAGPVQKLMVGLGFTVERLGGNHDIYYKRPFMNMEMHRRLISEDSPYNEYLSKTWDRAKLKDGCKCTYQLTHEDFYIYLLIHLTKHYAGGGTGVRSFLDIYLYNQCYGGRMDWNYIWTEVDKINLREFAENILGLCEVWFGNAQSKELYEEMTAYIFSSGAYGSRRNSIISSVSRKAGKKQSIRAASQLYRVKLFFPPLSTMKILYPFLAAMPLLLPACWVLRGIRSLLFKRRHTFQMLHQVHSLSEEDILRMGNLHKKAGLLK
ncbi:MAG: nucleotidyltransferase family protein [Desulfotomaculaceae bacterium]|nr:nucleotidyltransferase family protein [Desulfotomaculaceae bacterium]